MQEAIQVLSIINFGLMGLSHILQRRVWAEFFMLLHKQGRPGVFAHGFLSLIGGTLIVSFHNVWTGIPMALTIMGWLYVAKSVIVFLFPDVALRSLGRVRADNTHIFIAPGILMIALALALTYHLYLP